MEWLSWAGGVHSVNTDKIQKIHSYLSYYKRIQIIFFSEKTIFWISKKKKKRKRNKRLCCVLWRIKYSFNKNIISPPLFLKSFLGNAFEMVHRSLLGLQFCLYKTYSRRQHVIKDVFKFFVHNIFLCYKSFKCYWRGRRSVAEQMVLGHRC